MSFDKPTRLHMIGFFMALAVGCVAQDESPSRTPMDPGKSDGSHVDAGLGVHDGDGGRAPCLGAACPRELSDWVAMADGIRLHTLVFLPEGEGPWPVLLVRSPYVAFGLYEALVPLRDEGYAFVVQSVRGSGESEGEMSPLAQEFDDGRDSIEWIVQQPWASDLVATLGASYEGFTAVAAAARSPYVRAFVQDGAIADGFSGWPLQRGIHMHTGYLWWRHQVDGGEDPLTDPTWSTTTTNHRPIASLDELLRGSLDPVWQSYVEHSEGDSPFWRARSLLGNLEGLSASGLHFQAHVEWDDDPQQIYAEARRASDAPQHFVHHPHQHSGALYRANVAGDPIGRMTRDFLATHLKGHGGRVIDADRYYVAGRDGFLESEQWPVAVEHRQFFLGTDSLAESPGAPSEVAIVASPEVDDPCAIDFPRTLYFVSAPLTNPVDIVGSPEVVLRLRSTTPDADVFAQLWAVDSRGEYTLLHLSRLRLRFRNGLRSPEPMEPGLRYEGVVVRLPAIAQRVPAGSSLLLSLAGSECGAAENPNTGRPDSEAPPQTSTTTLYVGGDAGSSRLRLPIVSSGE